MRKVLWCWPLLPGATHHHRQKNLMKSSILRHRRRVLHNFLWYTSSSIIRKRRSRSLLPEISKASTALPPTFASWNCLFKWGFHCVVTLNKCFESLMSTVEPFRWLCAAMWETPIKKLCRRLWWEEGTAEAAKLLKAINLTLKLFFRWRTVERIKRAKPHSSSSSWPELISFEQRVFGWLVLCCWYSGVVCWRECFGLVNNVVFGVHLPLL